MSQKSSHWKKSPKWSELILDQLETFKTSYWKAKCICIIEISDHFFEMMVTRNLPKCRLKLKMIPLIRTEGLQDKWIKSRNIFIVAKWILDPFSPNKSSNMSLK